MLKYFDTDYQRGGLAARHGFPWTQEEERELTALFKQGKDLHTMCKALDRAPEAIIARLVKLQHLSQTPFGYVHNDDEDRTTATLTQKEPQMQPNIETKTFIGGVDAANMSDDEIFTKIGLLKATIARWESLNCGSAKLASKINALNLDVLELVVYVDGRL